MKQAAIRQVKSMSMSCDAVGNLLLAKFSCEGGKDACLFIPASIVFWLLAHIPVNQDPATPRALSVQCKQFPDAIRMAFELECKPGLTVLLNRSNVELMRQMMENYRKDLIDPGAPLSLRSAPEIRVSS